MFWDEDNRLMVLSDNGKTSRYTYNAGGERIIKSHGSMEGVYINGAPQGITFHETDEFTLYPASILSVSKHRFTKHYFIGDKRVASRIGLGEFNNVYGTNGSNVTAGQRDYAERMNQIENQREDYYKAAGVAPGLPTMKGSYADPEVTGVGYNVLIKELGDHSVPENWVQRPVVNTEAGSNPGAPLAWGSPENPDDVVAGYGYVAADTSEVEETFYYHSDHLGSTSYITDKDANVTQYDAYLPYGELLVDEHSSSEEMPYKFNGKELDEETGLYYYGARYMNPVTSMWYGVDPLAEKYVATGAYVYCMNNPVKFIDPDGKKTVLFATTLPGYPNPKEFEDYALDAILHGPLKPATHTFIAVFDDKTNALKGYFAFGPTKNGIDKPLKLKDGHYLEDRSRDIYPQDESVINNYINGIEDKNLKAAIEIAVPEGMSSEQFDKKVISTGKSYKPESTTRYLLQPVMKFSVNCNKGSYNLLKQSGVSQDCLNTIGSKLPGITWGWGQDMPWTKEEQKKAWSDYINSLCNGND